MFTRLTEDGVVRPGSELIHLYDLISLIFYDLGHGGLGVVVPVTSLGIIKVLIIVAVGVLYEAVTSGNQHPLDVMQILLHVLLCEENESVPTEHKVATALRYVGTFSVPGFIKFQILSMPGIKFV